MPSTSSSHRHLGALIGASAEGGGAPRARQDEPSRETDTAPAASPQFRVAHSAPDPGRKGLWGWGPARRARSWEVGGLVPGPPLRAETARPRGSSLGARGVAGDSRGPRVPARGGRRDPAPAARPPQPPPPPLLCVAAKRLSINPVWTVEREHKGCLLSG